MTTCPTCGKPVDPLRAPAVGVREGKVVSFCSKECAAATESKPTAAPEKLQPTKTIKRPRTEPPGPPPKATPPRGVPRSTIDLESGPIIEIITEKSKPAKKRDEDSAIQIADTGSIDDYVAPDSGRKGWLVVVLLVMLAGGGVAAAYFMGLFRNDAKSQPAAHETRVEAPPQPASAWETAGPRAEGSPMKVTEMTAPAR